MGDIKAVADALVAQVSNPGKSESRESAEKDVLALISIQNQIVSRKSKEKSRRKATTAPKPNSTLSNPSSLSYLNTRNDAFPKISDTEKNECDFSSLTGSLTSITSNPTSSTSTAPQEKQNIENKDAFNESSIYAPDALDSALQIIARLEVSLSEQSNESIQQQTLLRRQIDSLNEIITAQNLEKTNLIMQAEQLAILQQQLDLKRVKIETDYNCLMAEKKEIEVSGQINQDLVVQLKKTMEKKKKEWHQRFQTQQDSHTNQILSLSGEMDTIQRDWREKVEYLEGELRREKYEKIHYGFN